MLVNYPLISILFIFVSLYYISIKKVVRSKIFTKRKKYILISVVILIPIIGVFVPLFMLAEKKKRYFKKKEYGACDSDKIELFDTCVSIDDD